MTKDNLIIFESAMCCSTGICGPEPDKTLMEFSEAVKRLTVGYPNLDIKRASITFNLAMFLENKEIFQIVKEKGQDILPITMLNGKIIGKKKYLEYEELRKQLRGLK